MRRRCSSARRTAAQGDRLGDAGPEFAARGYRYVLQACRGTDGSGVRTATSPRRPTAAPPPTGSPSRPWFDGRLGSYGASYMGFTQWALASTRPPHLQAMAVALSTSVRKFSWYPGDSLGARGDHPVGPRRGARSTSPTDGNIVDDVTPGGGRAAHDRAARRRSTTCRSATSSATSPARTSPLYQDQLAHARADDPFWAALDFRGLLTDWEVPTSSSTAGTTTRSPACSTTTPSCATRRRRCACASAPAATSAAAVRAG